MTKIKKLIIITLEMRQRSPITVVAPDEWGNNIVDVAKQLNKELNNEDDVFIAINNKVIRRVHIESAIVQARSIN